MAEGGRVPALLATGPTPPIRDIFTTSAEPTEPTVEGEKSNLGALNRT